MIPQQSQRPMRDADHTLAFSIFIAMTLFIDEHRGVRIRCVDLVVDECMDTGWIARWLVHTAEEGSIDDLHDTNNVYTYC